MTVAYVAQPGGIFNLFWAGAGGAPKQVSQVADQKSRATFMTWSPDGETLAYEIDRLDGAGSQVWLAKDGVPAPIVVGAAESASLGQPESWSPAGDSLAYSVAEGSKISLEVSRPDGTSKQRLCPLCVQTYSFSWSNDGSQLALANSVGHATPHGESLVDILLVNRDGSHLERVAEGFLMRTAAFNPIGITSKW